MNKLSICIFCFFLIMFSLNRAYSHSFFVPRSITTNSVFELSLSNFDRYHSIIDSSVQMYVKPLYAKSTNQKELGRYFLPNNKQFIVLDEAGYGDVDPLWFNLISPVGSVYNSRLSLLPTRTVAGALLTFYSFLSLHWWFGLNTALIRAKHTLNMSEVCRTQLGTCLGFQTACQAFNNQDWYAGRFPVCPHSKTGFDDIQVKLGFDSVLTYNGHATFYAVGTIPTGKKQTSTILFEPVVGSNQWSIGLGFDGEYCVHEAYDHSLTFITDFKCRYVFGNTQRRSFDVQCNGDWSRYLLVITQQDPLLSLPAINLLTFPVKVTPAGTLDAWLALHYQKQCWHIELGYDFWWRQAESICQKCPIAQNYGIQNIALCSQQFTSASTAVICQSASGGHATVPDAVFTPITNKNINMLSGAHPTAISNMVSLNIGYEHDSLDWHTWLIGVGSSYECAHKNALSQWALWANLGLSF